MGLRWHVVHFLPVSCPAPKGAVAGCARFFQVLTVIVAKPGPNMS